MASISEKITRLSDMAYDAVEDLEDVTSETYGTGHNTSVIKIINDAVKDLNYLGRQYKRTGDEDVEDEINTLMGFILSMIDAVVTK